jgi:hypothetical protein
VRNFAYLEQKTKAKGAEPAHKWVASPVKSGGGVQDHTTLLGGLERGAKEVARVDLYEISKLPTVEDSEDASDSFDLEIYRAKKANALSKEHWWIQYLPQPNITKFIAKEGILAQGYAALKWGEKGVTGNTVTPYGIISYSIRTGEAPWDAFANAYDVAEQVRAGLENLGGHYADLAHKIVLDGSVDPLQKMSREINVLIPFNETAQAEGMPNSAVVAELKALQTRLGNTATALRKGFHVPLDNFDDELQDIARKVKDGVYEKENSSRLKLDIMRAYDLISVNLDFRALE